MFGLGFGEVILVLIIALVFIGPKKLPELAKGLGKGLREFQNAAKGFQDQITKEVDDLKPKIDPADLPKMEDITADIIPRDPPTTGHKDWDPYADHSKDPAPEVIVSTPEKKDEPKV